MLTLGQGLEPQPPPAAQHLPGPRPQLQISALDPLLYPLGHRRMCGHQRRAVARQLPQCTTLPRWNDTRLHPALPSQIRPPCAVAPVRLAPGHRLEMARGDHEDGAQAREKVAHRLPLHPRALYGHRPASDPAQPIPPLQQLVGPRGAGAKRFAPLGDQARYHRLGVLVPSTTTRFSHCPRQLLSGLAGAPRMSKRRLCLLTARVATGEGAGTRLSGPADRRAASTQASRPLSHQDRR